MTETKINKYKVVDYFDVWGNAEDGWEVNDVCIYYDTDETCLRISEETTDEEIIDFLIQIGYLKPEAKGQVYLESCDNEVIQIIQTKDDYPLGRLEMII